MSAIFGPLGRSLRLRQVVKNGFIFAGLVFSQRLFHFPDTVRVAAGFVLFTLVTWAVYLFNDVRDRELDRAHPVKSRRPVAAGTLPVGAAYLFAAVFVAAGLGGAFRLGFSFGICCLVYALLNVSYSLWLKNVVILDIMTIASGFFIRVVAGTRIIDVHISPWLLVCSIFVSLFLGFCKRRAELGVVSAESRPILKEYSQQFLDQLIAVLTSATILSYILYTVSPETVAKFRTERLILTAPFVLYGVFRFLYLMHTRKLGQDPAAEILSDPPLLITAAGWMIAVVAIIYR